LRVLFYWLTVLTSKNLLTLSRKRHLGPADCDTIQLLLKNLIYNVIPRSFAVKNLHNNIEIFAGVQNDIVQV